jgi:hypothetical protein
MCTETEPQDRQGEEHDSRAQPTKRVDRRKLLDHAPESRPTSDTQVERRIIESQDHIGVLGSQIKQTILLQDEGKRTHHTPDEESQRSANHKCINICSRIAQMYGLGEKAYRDRTSSTQHSPLTWSHL